MYLDLVMLLNFLTDLFLLIASNRLAGHSSDYKSILAAALLGGVYSGVCMIPKLVFLSRVHWRLVFLALMSVIAYGWSRSAIKRCGIFLILCLALGGVMTVLGGGSPENIFGASIILFLLFRIGFSGRKHGQELVPVEITKGGTTLKLTALMDTGNRLHDPVTGEPVLIIGQEEASRLIGLSGKQIRSPLETISSRAMLGLRLIPYKTVGQDEGMMLAIRCDSVKVNGKKRSMIVGFAPGRLEEGTYQALTGGYL